MHLMTVVAERKERDRSIYDGPSPLRFFSPSLVGPVYGEKGVGVLGMNRVRLERWKTYGHWTERENE